MSSRWLRWMPAAVTPVVVAAAVLAGPIQASAPVSLPTKTPAQVVALVAGSDVQALSGTFEQTVGLGLPQLPDVGPGTSSSSTNTATEQLLGLLTMPHTLRVYLEGATNQRMQVLDTLKETDVVRQGNTVWTYDSATNSATSLTLPAAAPSGATPPSATSPSATSPKMPGHVGPDAFPPDARGAPLPLPGSPAATPAQLAARFLANIGPSTQVALGPNTSVAGRDAYELVLSPRTAGTLVGKVSIAVDAATGLPLGVWVQATGADTTAFAVAFSTLDLTAPPASAFTFTPPPGATVTKASPPSSLLPRAMPGTLPGTLPGTAQAPAAPTTSGTGWATIVTTDAGTVPGSLLASPALAQVLQSVPGGQALETSLFSALVTTDGRLYAGAVPLAALQQAAQQAAAQQAAAAGR